MICYDPLWRTMEKKNITTYVLRNKHSISNSTIQRMKNNMPVSTNTLDVLCEILNCRVQDIIEHIPSEK